MKLTYFGYERIKLHFTVKKIKNKVWKKIKNECNSFFSFVD